MARKKVYTITCRVVTHHTIGGFARQDMTVEITSSKKPKDFEVLAIPAMVQSLVKNEIRFKAVELLFISEKGAEKPLISYPSFINDEKFTEGG